MYMHGYFRRIARKKPNLTAAMRKKRLAFAEKHADWTIED